MKTPFLFAVCVLTSVTFAAAAADIGIGIISPAAAKKLIENPDAKQRPIVFDTRGGYKDYFRGHLPTAHHLEFDTLRGTDKGVPVQYLPGDLTKALLVRAGVDKDRLHLVYATGDVLPNDEILSSTMVVHVLEKLGVKDIKIVDGGLPEWQKQGFAPVQDCFGNPTGSLPKKGNPGIAANIDDVQKHVGKPGNLLIDARPINEFQGEDEIWLRKGHIPGAISFHWARLMEKDNTHKFKPFSETKAELEKAGNAENGRAAPRSPRARCPLQHPHHRRSHRHRWPSRRPQRRRDAGEKSHRHEPRRRLRGQRRHGLARRHRELALAARQHHACERRLAARHRHRHPQDPLAERRPDRPLVAHHPAVRRRPRGAGGARAAVLSRLRWSL